MPLPTSQRCPVLCNLPGSRSREKPLVAVAVAGPFWFISALWVSWGLQCSEVLLEGQEGWEQGLCALSYFDRRGVFPVALSQRRKPSSSLLVLYLMDQVHLCAECSSLPFHLPYNSGRWGVEAHFMDWDLGCQNAVWLSRGHRTTVMEVASNPSLTPEPMHLPTLCTGLKTKQTKQTTVTMQTQLSLLATPSFVGIASLQANYLCLICVVSYSMETFGKLDFLV